MNEQRMEEENTQHILYNFLTERKFRFGRHILLVVTMMVVSTDQALFLLQKNDIHLLGYWLYVFFAYMLLAYLSVIYFNLFVLVPRLLLKKRFALYIALFLLSIVFYVFARFAIDYLIKIEFGFADMRSSYSGTATLLDFVSEIALAMALTTGISMIALFKTSIMDRKRIALLEQKRIKTEVEYLKEQVNPQSLFNMLNRASALAKTDPPKASKMLMNLSQLLRYQLYDCARERVLLVSEINFLNDYLTLEQLYSDQFSYKLTTEGNINMVFTSPLLFIPFVSHIVRRVHQQACHATLHLHFAVDVTNLSFTCWLDKQVMPTNTDYTEIRQRLDLLYPNRHLLSIAGELIKLQLNLKKP